MAGRSDIGASAGLSVPDQSVWNGRTIKREDRPLWNQNEINQAVMEAVNRGNYPQPQVAQYDQPINNTWKPDWLDTADKWIGNKAADLASRVGEGVKSVPFGAEGSRADRARDWLVDNAGDWLPYAAAPVTGGLSLGPTLSGPAADAATATADWLFAAPTPTQEEIDTATDGRDWSPPTIEGAAATAAAHQAAAAAAAAAGGGAGSGGGTGGGTGGKGGGGDGDGGPDTDTDVGDGDPDAGDTGPDPAGEETPPVEVLVEELFVNLVDDAEDAYVAAVEFYDERENVLGQNILDMEALRRAGIVDAAEAQRKALLELQRTRTERLRLDEIAATGRLGELEGFRRTQEQNVSDRIRDRGAGVRSDFDSRIAVAEAALAALGITSAPELDAAGSLGGALLDSQAGSQQALTDRFRVANEHAAVDRGMNLQGTYQQAAMALADYLWDANRQNDAAEQAGLQGLSEGVLGQQQELENTLANSRFSAGQDLRSQVGAFDPVTGQQINPMGGSLGAQNYAQLIQMRQEADAKAEAEAQRQAELARQAGFYGSVGNYMGLNEGAAQGFGETGLLPSLFDSLYGSQSGSSYENMVPVEMANGGEYFVDPMQYLKYQQDVANSQPLNLVPMMFEGQQIMMPIDKATDPMALKEFLALG